MISNVTRSAVSFKELLNKKYHIVIGKKGKEVDIDLEFMPVDFHHLAGLHKLKDLRLARDNRETVFLGIINGFIDDEFLTKSRYYDIVKDRIFLLTKLESLLDGNEIIFKYYKKRSSFSVIDASYLFSVLDNEKTVYIFVDKRDELNRKFFCRSFFPYKDIDYAQGQERWTLLYKEKINVDTGESVIQYQHPSYKPQK